MENLRKALNSISPIDFETWEKIQLLSQKRVFEKGAHFLLTGEAASNICFVEKGLLREYYVDQNGKEATRRFCVAGDLSGSLSDLISGGTAKTSIQALEKSWLICVPWVDIDKLSQESACLMRLMRKVAEKLYMRKSIREYEMLSLSSLQRYQNFARQEPELAHKLPRHMIASYLGISQVHLSRICAIGKPKRSPVTKT